MNRQLHLNTSNLEGNRRYSFLETPLEMHAPGHQFSEQRQNTQQYDQQYEQQYHDQQQNIQQHTEQSNNQHLDIQQHEQQYEQQQNIQQYNQHYSQQHYNQQFSPQPMSPQYNGQQYIIQQQYSSPTVYHTDQIQQQPVTQQTQSHPGIYNEKAQPLEQNRVASPFGECPPPEQHPANYAPYAEDSIQTTRQPSIQSPQYSYANPPSSPGPLPAKTNPEAPNRPPNIQTQNVSVTPDTNPLHSPQFPRFPPPAARSTPHIGTSEDITAYHQPGQISHPNQVIKGGAWIHGMCDCANIWTCCLGLICPCILYGKTQYRLSQKSRNEDPTNMLGYETCNGSCTAMALLCGCQWLMATIQHTRTRKAYGIRGDIGSDCVRATCCTCCTLIQDETEIKKREEERARAAIATGAALISPYTAPAQMTYGPPPR